MNNSGMRDMNREGLLIKCFMSISRREKMDNNKTKIKPDSGNNLKLYLLVRPYFLVLISF